MMKQYTYVWTDINGVQHESAPVTIKPCAECAKHFAEALTEADRTVGTEVEVAPCTKCSKGVSLSVRVYTEDNQP